MDVKDVVTTAEMLALEDALTAKIQLLCGQLISGRAKLAKKHMVKKSNFLLCVF